MYKNVLFVELVNDNISVSILVLMDLCIKTEETVLRSVSARVVSILVLMDLCIKTFHRSVLGYKICSVSILVLMDLCIKTQILIVLKWLI